MLLLCFHAAGVVMVPAGVSDSVMQCNPYDYYSAACWGAAPICSYANVCIGIDTYDYDWAPDWDDSYPWGERKQLRLKLDKTVVQHTWEHCIA